MRLEDLDTKAGSQREAWVDISQKKRSCLKQILRPILVCMALSGCYNFSDLNYIAKNEDKKITAKYVFSIAYRVFYLLLMLILCVKFCIQGFVMPNYKLMAILTVVWTLLIVITLLVNLKQTSRTHGHYEQAFKLWEEKVIPECIELGVELPVAKMKHRTLVVSIVAVVLAVISTCSIAIQMLYVIEDFYVYPFEATAWSHVLVIVPSLFACMAWIVPQANAAALCRSLTALFKSFNKYMERTIIDNNYRFPDNFTRMRLLHLNLCNLVEELDNDFSWFFATDFVFVIFISLFILYQMIKTSMNTISLVLLGTWFIQNIAIMVVTATFSAFTNVAVSIKMYMCICKCLNKTYLFSF